MLTYGVAWVGGPVICKTVRGLYASWPYQATLQKWGGSIGPNEWASLLIPSNQSEYFWSYWWLCGLIGTRPGIQGQAMVLTKNTMKSWCKPLGGWPPTITQTLSALKKGNLHLSKTFDVTQYLAHWIGNFLESDKKFPIMEYRNITSVFSKFQGPLKLNIY